MLLVDDILLFPVHGMLWIFKEIHNAAQQEKQGEAEAITTELMELYMLLETGKITENEFDSRERDLLDRLDDIEKEKHGEEDEEDNSGEEPV
ncbi:MAG: gas vesicle protein GvpG [Candidatus Sumerlaeota bacterium]|nr:gas vesicle protein GvpG [Candidatus Sumerlaeota bacterium]